MILLMVCLSKMFVVDYQKSNMQIRNLASKRTFDSLTSFVEMYGYKFCKMFRNLTEISDGFLNLSLLFFLLLLFTETQRRNMNRTDLLQLKDIKHGENIKAVGQIAMPKDIFNHFAPSVFMNALRSDLDQRMHQVKSEAPNIVYAKSEH